MNEQTQTDTEEKPKKPRKKTVRMRTVKEMESDFIGKAELAKHLNCHISTIGEWIANGTIPPPHSRPGAKHPVWLRKHYKIYRDTAAWPQQAWWKLKD